MYPSKQSGPQGKPYTANLNWLDLLKFKAHSQGNLAMADGKTERSLEQRTWWKVEGRERSLNFHLGSLP